MKHLKKLLALLLALALVCGLLPAVFAAPAAPVEPNAGDVAINETNFPDANFRAFVKQYDTNNNGYLSSAELAAVTEMDCSSKSIANLKGIEHFTALSVLYCYSNQLTTLDLSKNTALARLNCHSNQLTSLDVSKNTALERLYCSGNQLTSLDLSKNTALTELYCYGNQLTTLDLSKNTALERLYCYGNQLTSLDLSKNKALTLLSCFDNQLTSLDLSQNTALTLLSCYGNQLTTLDLSKNTALTELSCYGNQLTTLDLSKNTALESLRCFDNQLTSLDVSMVPALKDAVENGTKDTSYSGWDKYSSSQGTLYVDKTVTIIYDERGVEINDVNFPDANFRSFVSSSYDKDGNGWLSDTERNAVKTMSVKRMNMSDLTGVSLFPNLTSLECHQNTIGALVMCNPKLTYLKCYDNGMTVLDVTGCPALEELRCEKNQLTALDLSKNPALTYLECSDNQLTELELRYNLELTKLFCLRNQLAELKVKGLTKLTELYCTTNALTSLDVDGLISLTTLSCADNQLPGIENLACCTQLSLLFIENNQFSVLRVPALPNLARLHCQNNQITVLELPELPSLNEFWCNANQLTSLDLHACPALRYLNCRNNALTGLDVSGCPEMAGISCYGNYLPCLDIRSNPTLLNLVQTAALDTSESAYDCYDNGSTSNNVHLYFDKGQTLITSGSGIPVDGVHFPDDNFRARVSYLDIDKNSLLSDEERSVDNLYYEDCGIVSLRGIEYFPELTTFSCLNNQLTELDLSGNPKLTSLNCAQNQLTRLDLSGNPLMETVYCYDNQMKALNISGCTELRFLSAFSNQLETLDIRTNPKLVNLIHTVSRKTYDYFGLEYYSYNTDGFESSLAYDKDVAIYDVGEGILIDAVNFPDDNFRAYVRQFDENSNGFLTDAERAAVKGMDCSRRLIKTLQGVEYFTALTELDCGVNSLVSLDVSKNTALTRLDCGSNSLASLDVSKNTALTELNCSLNHLASLDVSKNTALTELYCGVNSLSSLDVSKNTALTGLDCGINSLSSLDVSKNTALTYLSCAGNHLTSLDLRPVPALNFTLGYYAWTGKAPHADHYCYKTEKGELFVDPTGVELLFTMNPFTDVKEGKFYYEPVLWAYYFEPQVTAGTDATHFSPTKTCTRGQVVTFLWRANGCPEPTLTENPFTDVKKSAFYYKAVLWAVENGVTTGTSPTTFGPNNPCTRAQVVTFLWRAEGSPAPTTTTCPFTDVKTSGFYYEAMLWAVENGVTTGTSPTTFGPGKPCTRGQVVSFLQRAVE